MSHHKNHKSSNSKKYEYKVISSNDLKKRDQAWVDEYLNALGAKGWDVVTISLNETNGKGISFSGLVKRKTYANDHPRH